MGTPSTALLEILDLRLLGLKGCLFQLSVGSFVGTFAILVILELDNVELPNR